MLRTLSARRGSCHDLEQLEARRLLSATSYTIQKLVSDGSDSSAFKTDTRLKNAWGLAVGPRGIEVADNGTGVGTMYDGNGNNVVGTVKVPGHAGAKGAPTGVAFNANSADFGGAQFIFVTENGTIDSWSGNKADKTAAIKVDNAGAVYKGAAIGGFKHKQFLYVANFTGGTIEVYDSSFKKTHVSSKFPDATLPKGFSPFNVTNIGGDLYVMYAKRAKGDSDETAGAGLGVVDIFSTAGKLLKRFTTGGTLNAPWGVAVAPSNFGTFSGDVLIGNFGDGKITAFDPTTGASKGQVSDANNTPIVLEGLWGLAFGNNKAGNLTNGLYFGAGTNDEANGLYGRVIADQPNPSTQSGGDGAFHYALHRPSMGNLLEDMFGERLIGIDGMIM
jgi:uncharacterized protein (TIGR03118 family)